MTSSSDHLEYRRLLARAKADDDVLGLVLVGSRAHGASVEEDSDWDARLIVADDRVTEVGARYGTRRGGPVEVALLSRSSFLSLAEPDSPLAWDRYSYARGQVALDKLDGAVQAVVAELTTLPRPVATALAADALDGYINSYYRALKDLRAGLLTEAHLDGNESIPPLLTALFAMHRRVRPFNKWLGWELDHFPVPGAVWSGQQLLPRLAAQLATFDPAASASLFRDVESLVRAHGLGHVIDSWAPDVPLLRRGLG